MSMNTLHGSNNILTQETRPLPDKCTLSELVGFLFGVPFDGLSLVFAQRAVGHWSADPGDGSFAGSSGGTPLQG